MKGTREKEEHRISRWKNNEADMISGKTKVYVNQWYTIYSRRYISLILLLFAVITLSAQQKITGTVKDSNSGRPVPDVYIMLMSEDGKKILTYSYSQPDGTFTIELPQTTQQTFLLTTSRMGYEPYSEKISAQMQKTDIRLKESSVPLREVKITSSPMRRRGDTINYYMSSFTRPQDRNLADVLARMPGIEVQNDGAVQYEGKPINRFYIEDMNLLGRRYSLATKNLSPGDIAAVQVYENHEPIKMLRDRSNTEQAALNIKLKEGARAKWLRTFDFGVGGFPLLYDATGTFARFARKNQTMMVGKVNNTGKDIALELKMHKMKVGQVFRLSALDGIPDCLSPLSVATSFFTQDRARFNESAIVSLNQLWRMAEDVDMKINVNYGFEREKRSRSVETEYRFENRPSLTLSDYTAQTVNWHKLENECTFSINKTRYFLEEKLSADIHWKEAFADVSSNAYGLHQKMHLPRFHLRNDMSLSKLLGNVSMGIGNKAEFTRLPQRLTLASSDTLPLFSDHNIRQSVCFVDGFCDNYITLNYRKHYHTFDMKTGAEWVWQAVESELSPLPQVHDIFANDFTWNTSRLYAEPSYRLEYHKWTITSSASINYMYTDYSGKKKNYTYINPRIKFVFRLNANLKLNTGYSRNINYGDLNEMQTGYVFKRYNLFSKGIDELERNASQSFNWGVSYKNTMQFFNLNYIGLYTQYKNNLVPARFIQDIYTFSLWNKKDRTSTFWMNTVSAMKLFTEISLTAGLNLSYNQSKSVVEQQGAFINYISHTFGLEPSLKWNAKSNLNFDYTMSAFFSGVSVNRRPIDAYIPLINHRLYTYFGLNDRLSFTFNLQHFFNKSPDASISNLLFADLGIRYAFKRVTVHLDWTNLFNRKQHITDSYNTINTIRRIDKLRPSEILISFRFKY